MGWLVDTCLWLDLENRRIGRGDLERFTGGEPACVSPVTLAELAAGVEAEADPRERERRAASLAKTRKEPLLLIDDGTAMAFGTAAGVLRRKGLLRDRRVQDLWIASQAIQHGFKLLTRNARDFEDIPGLELVKFEGA